MFVRFLHGLQSVLNRVFQGWTKENVPQTDYKIRHDFHDDNGPVPAIPLDNSSIRNDVIKLMEFPVNIDTSSIKNDITKIVGFPINSDSSSVNNNIINMLAYPINSDNCALSNNIISIELIEG